MEKEETKEDTKKAREKELIERVKNGDTEAYYDLVSDFRIRLFRKACSLLGNADDAEDVVQDSLITAFNNLAKFRGESGIYTWIYRIVVNKCRDNIRNKIVKKEDSMEYSTPILSDDRVSIEKNLELSEDSSYLIDKINQMDKKYREVVILKYYDNMSYQEIAEVVHTNVGTIKSRLFKARELLKGAIVNNGKGEDYFEI